MSNYSNANINNDDMSNASDTSLCKMCNKMYYGSTMQIYTEFVVLKSYSINKILILYKDMESSSVQHTTSQQEEN